MGASGKFYGEGKWTLDKSLDGINPVPTGETGDSVC